MFRKYPGKCLRKEIGFHSQVECRQRLSRRHVGW